MLAETSLASSEVSSSSSSSSSAGAKESLMNILKSPVLYIVLGAIVLLIIAIYLFRRMVKARPGATIIIVRKGKIHQIVDDKNPKYFMIPFRDSIGAIITEGEKSFSSDKLFINNGPDALYKINYTLKYKILDPKAFYPYLERINELLPIKLNDELRLFADQGNALVLVKDYRENADKILEVINKAVEGFHIHVSEFKINIIEPMGGR